jgi:hypothetical protein
MVAKSEEEIAAAVTALAGRDRFKATLRQSGSHLERALADAFPALAS